MRKVLALGATILFVGSVGVAGAQERLQQCGGSAMGVGTGVGDISGSANRVQAFDRNSFLDRLSQPETVYGRVIGIDIPAKKMHLESGGSSHDEGRAGAACHRRITEQPSRHLSSVDGNVITLRNIRGVLAKYRYHAGKLRSVGEKAISIRAPSKCPFCGLGVFRQERGTGQRVVLAGSNKVKWPHGKCYLDRYPEQLGVSQSMIVGNVTNR